MIQLNKKRSRKAPFYILANASKVAEYDADVKNGDWIRSRLFCFFSRPTHELEGKTLGIFGFGTVIIGDRKARTELKRRFHIR